LSLCQEFGVPTQGWLNKLAVKFNNNPDNGLGNLFELILRLGGSASIKNRIQFLVARADCRQELACQTNIRKKIG
jgi:hypothetical protein